MVVRRTILVLATVGLAALLSVPPVPAGPAPGALGPYVASALGTPALEPVDASLPDLVRAWDARLGVVRDPAELQVLDQLDPELASTVADLLGALLAAAEVRDDVFEGVSDEELLSRADDVDGAVPVDGAPLRAAAAGLAQVVETALPRLEAYASRLPTVSAPLATPPLVSLPPVLVLDPLGVPTTFTKDAALALDVGGDDLWDMNAGGSLIGIIPTADPASCQFNALNLVAVGCEFNDAIVSITASLAIDVSGNDHYGVRRPAQLQDTACTTASIIRRIVMQGAGSGGLGMLVDAAGDDVYDAKTLSQGMGHIAGVGVLADLGGNDAYTAIRSSQGAAILGGVGVFLDAGGHDTHTFAGPPGGIFNVDAGACDATARFGLGAAAVAADAYFYELDGDDTYRVSPLGLGEATLGHAVFLDRAGTDDYGGYPGRGNGVRLVNSGGMGLFVDL
jgi:hypothetical protein